MFFEGRENKRDPTPHVSIELDFEHDEDKNGMTAPTPQNTKGEAPFDPVIQTGRAPRMMTGDY